ncbi:hypothetical protein HO173_009551 [Letharia columbiana]|uniref:Amidohydrolase-related domain-containing protein n=1 Tax=Letharia columbiana TaxID=112416 RepID=A0A8H6FP83_9LECA|nr:uncharacterized protein HO173_009551 [Letharia columbiana]KAF6232168.1 hypothetical protein HO173_009551 [Letharia columbiana]
MGNLHPLPLGPRRRNCRHPCQRATPNPAAPSHAGGTLPFLAWRLDALCSVLFANLLTDASPKVVEDAKSFYFDVALSGSGSILDSLLEWAPKERVLYGSGFPYATTEAEWNDKVLEGYEVDEGDEGGDLLGECFEVVSKAGGEGGKVGSEAVVECLTTSTQPTPHTTWKNGTPIWENSCASKIELGLGFFFLNDRPNRESMIDTGTSTQIRQYNSSSDLDLSRDPLLSETFRRVPTY